MEAINDKFGQVGYSSLYILRNFGLFFFTILLTPIFWLTVYVVIHFYFKGKYKELELKIWNGLFWNGTLTFINEGLLFIAMCASLNTFYLKWDTIGNTLNSLSCFVFLAITLVYVIVVVVVLNTDKIYNSIQKKNEALLSKFFSILSDLNFKREGRKVMIYRSFSVARVIILVSTLVYMNRYPLFSVISLNFQSLICIIILGYTMPFSNKQTNKLELMNEFFVLVTLYHFFCFTDFLLDFDTKDKVGVSLIVFTVTNLAINLTVITVNSVLMFIGKHKVKYL